MSGSSLLEIMKDRRSVRCFTDEPIKRNEVMELIKGAILAPSGSNIQPWVFGVIDDKEQLDKVFSFSPGLGGEPTSIIVVCSNRELAFKKGDKLGCEEMAIIDVSMASENILLLATEKGLATCIVKSFNTEAVKEILNLPYYITPDIIITLGYAKKIRKSPPKKSIEEVVFFNHWEGVI